ncbi:cell wall hydrolase/autolysin [Syntrophobotulus glycolicus DSM 8271]|uniref:Cell wall hydrolase/autolysin n=1 Tax=Syntrophobotulus glycolicus (strain DSM 8271 / FlGlyR) TaxID=645991 RepID=F0SX48_SYNGF|nr:N-acetylmuramoyl-L-alanine amidase [Syntrophobotulus glycolicus]ADY54894.1 cell wall hydrolase/autolysin [Syntrophobotulus glycolicus DSM 8271]ADY56908.1 cell wall hydrolase/autolysin [Syntrophobotulus glycolicus DSM 8271]ADY57245.1 cell wall hydrolase/autolysin [Syntrophobotulus glycolicus DSM 8271]ADY57417.1 cell wall hydrolase/autolysin [Syntrophobotulus glycolicus DSM 8271]
MKKVTIDPGHAPGNVNKGPTGYYEYAGMWKLSNFLRNALIRCGIDASLTRSENEDPSLDERGKRAKGSDVFISEHSNAANGQARGVECFYSVRIAQDKAWAGKLSAAVSKVMGNNDRGAKTRESETTKGYDYYGVIRSAVAAGVPHVFLIENGFHDNAVDEAFLKVDANLESMAEAQVKVICELLGVTYIEKGAVPAEQLYRVRKTWEDAKSQVGAYRILENAKVECDKNPGYSVFDEKGQKVYPLSSSVPQPPKEEPKEQGTLIMGKTEATAAQMAAYALKVNPKPLLPSCTIEELAKIFVEEAEVEGVRADVAWAQSLKETGCFKYGGIVLPEQNNYAGIGALNGNSQGQAASFESPRLGARAQIQHLKAYASTEALKQACVDPRFGLVKRGSAIYIEWLGAGDNPNGAGWAYPGNGYGADIIKILNAILKEPVVLPPPQETPQEESSVPRWQRDGFDKLVAAGVISSPEYWSAKLGDTITIGEVFGILGKMCK